MNIIIQNLSISPESIRESYKEAQRTRNIELLQELSRNYTIRADFKFLGDFYYKCIEEKKYEFLPYPYFSTVGEDFRGVVEKLTQRKFQQGLVKKFGITTLKYGVNFLNNFFLMKRVHEKEDFNIDHILNLDHSSPLLPGKVYGLFSSKILFQRYSLKRMMMLLLNARDYEILDTNHIIKSHSNPDELLPLLPKKPKTFREVHDALSIGIMKRNSPNVPLNQSLYYLNGKPIKDYIIEVPNFSHDLIDTSKELSHCVHFYSNKVRHGSSHIINLKRDGKRIYTIELMRDPTGSFNIIQFKGKFNEDSMESALGDEIRRELLSMIKI